MCHISRYISILLTFSAAALIYCTQPVISIAAEVTAITNTSASSDTCLKCHKRNGQMLGLHGNPGLAIVCQDCHGEKGNHPKKGASLNQFGIDSPLPAQQQAAVCLTCHDNETLADADWTHNVHAVRVGCAQCHQLHPESDPMLSLSRQQHSQLCVTCHKVNP